jgi:hypothetical protein
LLTDLSGPTKYFSVQENLIFKFLRSFKSLEKQNLPFKEKMLESKILLLKGKKNVAVRKIH